MPPHHDVLVVDDDDATRLLLSTLIARAGLTVTSAANGEEAAAVLDEGAVDAIVLDLFMPRLNGSDLLALLGREHEEMLGRVIVLSAAPEPALHAARQQYPIWCAMRKPADISELMQNVLDCVGSAARPS